MRKAAVNSLVLAVCLAFCPVATAQENASPNIVFVFTDDQGINDVGCYGSEIPTPNIDSIARDGARFTSFYAASAICTPSRFGLLTGRYPTLSQDRMLGALMFLDPSHAERGIHEHETTYVELLQRQGYRTALVGKWHLGHGEEKFWPTEHGFDSFFGHTGGCVDYFTMRYGLKPDWYRDRDLVDINGYATDIITDEAVRFLQRHDDDRPFYLHVAYNAPHFGKGWDYQRQSTANILQARAEDMVRAAGIEDITRRQFAAMTVRLDDGIGRILQAIEDTGLRDNTLVVFMTDHGGDPVYGGSNEPFRGGKATLFEGGIRVPCLLRYPGVIQPGTEISQAAWALDFFPTFCSLAGTELEEPPLGGEDLLSIISGERRVSRELYWELGNHEELNRKKWIALLQGNWKYVVSPGDGEMLFDIEADPNEEVNLAESHEDVRNDMEKRAHEISALHLLGPGSLLEQARPRSR